MSRPGVALLEVMVATALIGIAASAAVSAAAAELRAARRAIHVLEANALAEYIVHDYQVGGGRRGGHQGFTPFGKPFEEYEWNVMITEDPSVGQVIVVTVRGGRAERRLTARTSRAAAP